MDNVGRYVAAEIAAPPADDEGADESRRLAVTRPTRLLWGCCWEAR